MAPPTLIELDEAREAVLRAVSTLASEPVPLPEALGRYLAEDVLAGEPVPGFDNSAMDGFALRAADTRGAAPAMPASLRLAGESRAGLPATRPLGEQEVIRISTGAAIPEGADAVLRVEAARLEDERVLIEEVVAPGRDVRFAGDDLEAGSLSLPAGARLGPAELGVLASVGRPLVSCHKRPRIAVLTSGDELIGPDEPLRSGAVRNSNGYSIPALAELSGADVLRADPMPDQPEATRRAIEPLLDAEVVVVCGGVSVGDHDHVKDAFAALEIRETFWGVALRPGKPTWFGARGNTLVFGLPGNPVSAMVTFLLFVRPALLALSGGSPATARIPVRLGSEYEKAPGRTHAVRSRLELREDGWWAHPFERQGSHVLTSMLGADCLVLVPAALSSARVGDRLEAEMLEPGWRR